MNKLGDIFDKMDEGELTQLLEGVRGEKLDPSAKKALRARLLPGLKGKRRARFPRLAVGLAASMALVCLAGGVGLAVEVRAYNEAVAFFEEYDLSMEGLTRAEIKEVYRDITTNSFTYAKTAQVIGESVAKNTVGGWSIAQEEPTAEEMRTLWETIRANGGLTRPAGIWYDYRNLEAYSSDPYGAPTQWAVVERYEDGELVWSTEVRPFGVYGLTELADGILVWGEQIYGRQWNTMAWLCRLDDEGEILWIKPMTNGFTDEYITAVVEREDGTLAVLSRGELKVICLTVYSPEGERLSFFQNEEMGYGISCACRLGDGFLAALGSYGQKFAKLDGEGRITEIFDYDSGDAVIRISEMAEYGGQIYLSGYSVPVAKAGSGHQEIAPVLEYVYDGHWDITGEELTPLVRDNYTALLLVCDPETCRIESFYEVPGSLGGRLTAGANGELLWDVKSIASTYYSPATNAFTVGGICQVYRYAFAPDGTLLGQSKTGEVTSFSR